jgi:hypothetical protein
LALIIFVVSEKKAFEHFPIGSIVNICIAMAGLSLTLDPMGKMFQTAFSLKPLGHLKPNCPGMIIGRSSTNSMFFMPIEIQDGRHRNTYINNGPYGKMFKCPNGFKEEAF